MKERFEEVSGQLLIQRPERPRRTKSPLKTLVIINFLKFGKGIILRALHDHDVDHDGDYDDDEYSDDDDDEYPSAANTKANDPR